MNRHLKRTLIGLLIALFGFALSWFWGVLLEFTYFGLAGVLVFTGLLAELLKLTGIVGKGINPNQKIKVARVGCNEERITPHAI